MIASRAGWSCGWRLEDDVGTSLRRRAMVAGLATALVVSAGLASGCGPTGGTVRVAEGESAVVFTARAGKANVVVVTQSAGDVLVKDSGDTLIPEAPCTAVDASTVRCPNPDFINIELGDGNDTGTNDTAIPSSIEAGSGKDVANGGGVDDFLVGDGGSDVLNGRGGNDTLSESSNGTVADLVDEDTFIGGPGTDHMTYGGSAGVVVDLDGIADDGRAREKDNVRADVEHLTGTFGADRLTGNGSPNTLDGSFGSDGLFGLAGFDQLVGGEGTDTCDTGAGGGQTLDCES
jgi:Ca2+-binding RTX toxin-like protein